jgi:hypothetical protein
VGTIEQAVARARDLGSSAGEGGGEEAADEATGADEPELAEATA